MNLIEELGGEDVAQNLISNPDAKNAEYIVLGTGYISDLSFDGGKRSLVNAVLHEKGQQTPIKFAHYFDSVESVIEFSSTYKLSDIRQALIKYRREKK